MIVLRFVFHTSQAVFLQISHEGLRMGCTVACSTCIYLRFSAIIFSSSSFLPHLSCLFLFGRCKSVGVRLVFCKARFSGHDRKPSVCKTGASAFTLSFCSQTKVAGRVHDVDTLVHTRQFTKSLSCF